jgi:hypothetical protein
MDPLGIIMVLPAFATSVPQSLQKKRRAECALVTYVVSAAYDSSLGLFKVDEDSSGNVVIVRKGVNNRLGLRSTRVPARMAGAFAMMSGMVKHLVKLSEDDPGQLPDVDWETLWVVAHVREQTFAAAEEAVAMGQISGGWFRSFNHLWTHLWYGFPPTSTGTAWLESSMNQIPFVLRWDDWESDALLLDTGRAIFMDIRWKRY